MQLFYRYEMHYSIKHRYQCGQCKQSLPTQHLLDIHLMECHDALFQLNPKQRAMVATVAVDMLI
jgi:hypothetical protein